MRSCLALVLAVLTITPAVALDLSDYRMIDLSHGYGENTLYWPTSQTEYAE